MCVGKATLQYDVTTRHVDVSFASAGQSAGASVPNTPFADAAVLAE